MKKGNPVPVNESCHKKQEGMNPTNLSVPAVNQLMAAGLLDQICFLTDHPGFFTCQDEIPHMPPLVENKAVSVYFPPLLSARYPTFVPEKKGCSAGG